MLGLGLVLIAMAAVVVLAFATGTGDDRAVLTVAGIDAEPSTLAVFLAGCGTVLLLWLGLRIARTAIAQDRRRRKDKRELERLSVKLEEAERRRSDEEDGA